MVEWFKSLFGGGKAGSGGGAPAGDRGGGSRRGDSPRSARELAERGENLAARHLRDLGYKIILRNFRSDIGEVDIIARDGKDLVFVEVKARESDEVSPESQVNLEKQKQVAKVARQYLSRYGTPQPAFRFDIVAIVWPSGREPRIEHFQNAFEA